LITGSLAEGARVSSARLKMNKDETEALVQHFVGYARELRGPNIKPVPPFLFETSKDIRDHSREVYEEVIMPGFRRMSPAPKLPSPVSAPACTASGKRKRICPSALHLRFCEPGTTQSWAGISCSRKTRGSLIL
jgi:hypothetical protein